MNSAGTLTMVLNPTSQKHLIDAKGYPYFLWDVSLSLEEFLQLLNSDDKDIRAYWIGKLMRQAKPDDVFLFVKLQEIRALWFNLSPYLGNKREFWSWLLNQWKS